VKLDFRGNGYRIEDYTEACTVAEYVLCFVEQEGILIKDKVMLGQLEEYGKLMAMVCLTIQSK
jgi:hypothetical protein